MKGRIKAGDLRQVGPQLHHAPDGRQVMWLVQWHKGNEFFQPRYHVRIDERRPGEPGPAMRHPMPNGNGSQTAAVMFKSPACQIGEGFRMSKTISGAIQGDFREQMSELIFCFEARGRTQAFNLAAGGKLECAIFHAVNRELQAR